MKEKVARGKADFESGAGSFHPIARDVALGVAGGTVGAFFGGPVGAAIGSMAGVAASEVMSCEEDSSNTGLEIRTVVGYLERHLGPKVTTYLSGANNIDVLGAWIEGVARPEELPARRLQIAHEATRYLVNAFGGMTAKSWFMGTNDLLDSESPAYVLRHGQTSEDWAFVIPAARQFVEHAR